MNNPNATPPPLQVAILTTDQIRDFIRDAYEAGKVAGAMPAKMWGVADVAKFLGVSPDTVYTLAQNREIPCQRAGNRYIFHPETVNAWAAGKR